MTRRTVTRLEIMAMSLVWCALLAVCLTTEDERKSQHLIDPHQSPGAVEYQTILTAGAKYCHLRIRRESRLVPVSGTVVWKILLPISKFNKIRVPIIDNILLDISNTVHCKRGTCCHVCTVLYSLIPTSATQSALAICISTWNVMERIQLMVIRKI